MYEPAAEQIVADPASSYECPHDGFFANSSSDYPWGWGYDGLISTITPSTPDPIPAPPPPPPSSPNLWSSVEGINEWIDLQNIPAPH